jgi:hypothetical protein
MRILTYLQGDQKFVIKDIPGKGLGAVATRRIQNGEIIISEAPLFTQGRVRQNSTIIKSLAEISDQDKRRFLELANCHKADPKFKNSPFLGIFDTNALPCGVNDTSGNSGQFATTAGLFLQCSRFNSDCTPNVHNYWNEKQGLIFLRALKDIVEGEELCLCYSGEWRPRNERRKKLKESFKFQCRCATCSLDGDQQLRSDQRRAQLGALYEEIGGCAGDPALGVKKVCFLPGSYWHTILTVSR